MPTLIHRSLSTDGRFGLVYVTNTTKTIDERLKIGVVQINQSDYAFFPLDFFPTMNSTYSILHFFFFFFTYDRRCDAL